jgi:hypothetical protein
MPVSTLALALTHEHEMIRDLAEPCHHPDAARPDRRHETDWFYAITAQHMAAAEDVLLPRIRRLPDGRVLVSTYVGNARQLERSLRFLKARIYGDSRVQHLRHEDVWREIDRLLAEHEQLEVDCVGMLCEQLDEQDANDLAEKLLSAGSVAPTRAHPYSPHTGPASKLAHRVWRLMDTAWDSAEGRVVPTEYREHPKRDSALSHYLRGTPIPETEEDSADPETPRPAPPDAPGGAAGH